MPHPPSRIAVASFAFLPLACWPAACTQQRADGSDPAPLDVRSAPTADLIEAELRAASYDEAKPVCDELHRRFSGGFSQDDWDAVLAARQMVRATRDRVAAGTPVFIEATRPGWMDPSYDVFQDRNIPSATTVSIAASPDRLPVRIRVGEAPESPFAIEAWPDGLGVQEIDVEIIGRFFSGRELRGRQRVRIEVVGRAEDVLLPLQPQEADAFANAFRVIHGSGPTPASNLLLQIPMPDAAVGVEPLAGLVVEILHESTTIAALRGPWTLYRGRGAVPHCLSLAERIAELPQLAPLVAALSEPKPDLHPWSVRVRMDPTAAAAHARTTRVWVGERRLSLAGAEASQ